VRPFVSFLISCFVLFRQFLDVERLLTYLLDSPNPFVLLKRHGGVVPKSDWLVGVCFVVGTLEHPWA